MVSRMTHVRWLRACVMRVGAVADGEQRVAEGMEALRATEGTSRTLHERMGTLKVWERHSLGNVVCCVRAHAYQCPCYVWEVNVDGCVYCVRCDVGESAKAAQVVQRRKQEQVEAEEASQQAAQQTAHAAETRQTLAARVQSGDADSSVSMEREEESSKFDALKRRTLHIRDALGLNIVRLKGNALRFAFTRIDPQDDERVFSFTLRMLPAGSYERTWTRT